MGFLFGLLLRVLRSIFVCFSSNWIVFLFATFLFSKILLHYIFKARKIGISSNKYSTQYLLILQKLIHRIIIKKKKWTVISLSFFILIFNPFILERKYKFSNDYLNFYQQVYIANKTRGAKLWENFGENKDTIILKIIIHAKLMSHTCLYVLIRARN